MTSVMLHHPYIRFRRGRTGLLFHGSSFAIWDLAGSLAVVASKEGEPGNEASICNGGVATIEGYEV